MDGGDAEFRDRLRRVYPGEFIAGRRLKTGNNFAGLPIIYPRTSIFRRGTKEWAMSAASAAAIELKPLRSTTRKRFQTITRRKTSISYRRAPKKERFSIRLTSPA